MISSFQSRCIVLCSVLVAGLSVLSGRLVQIQLVDRKHYEENSRRDYRSIEKLPAHRGMIVDRLEEPLAKCIPVSTVIANKKRLMDPKMASVGLAYAAATPPGPPSRLSARERHADQRPSPCSVNQEIE